MSNNGSDLRFSCLYNVPGEGLVAEFKCGTESLLFDRRGLQSRILLRKRRGEDTGVEEQALARMNALSVTAEPDSGELEL
jgi:hypothetical protein